MIVRRAGVVAVPEHEPGEERGQEPRSVQGVRRAERQRAGGE